MTSKNCFDSILQHISDGVLIVDQQGIICFANPAATKLFDKSLSELIGEKFAVPIVTGKNTELEIVHPNGEVIIGEMSCGETQWENQPASVICIRDITQKRRIEIDLLESEQKFRQLAEHIHQVFFIQQPDYQAITYVSPAYEVIWGKTCQSLYDNPHSWLELVHPDDLELVNHQLNQQLTEFIPFECEYRIVKPNGEIRWIFAQTFLLKDKQGNLEKILGVAEDITERKLAEEKSQEAYRFLQLITDNIPAMIAYVDNQEYYRFTNKFYEFIWGKSPQEVIGNKIADVIGETYKLAKANIKQVLQGEIVSLEHPACFPNQQISYVKIQYIPHLEQEKVLGFFVLITDISQEKATEKALQLSEQRYRRLYENTPAMLYSINTQGQLISVSNRWLEVLGYQRDEVIGHRCTDFLTEESRYYAENVSLPEFFRKGFCQNIALQFMKKNGEIIDILLSAIWEKDSEGHPTHSLAVSIDVTEQRQAEKKLQRYQEHLEQLVQERTQALESSQARLAGILDSANDAIISVDEQQNITLFNQGAEKIFGYQATEIIGQSLDNLLPESLINIHHSHVNNFVNSGVSSRQTGQSGEVVARRKDGSEFPAEVSISCMVLPNQQIMTAILRDISDRKQTETRLKLSQESLLKAQEIAHLGNWDWHITNNYLYWSDEIYRIFGVSPQEFGATYEAFLEYVHPQDRELVINAVNQALFNHQLYSIDHRIIRQDGTVRIVHEQADVIFDQQGVAIRMIGTVQDITERKQIEIALRDSEQRYFHLAETVPVGIYLNNREGECIYINKRCAEIIGVNFENLKGFSWLNYIYLPDYQLVLHQWQQCLNTGSPFQLEYRFQRPDGQIIWVYALAIFEQDQQGKITGSLGTITDITQRKQAEISLRESEERLQYRLKLETAIAEVSTKLVNSENVDLNSSLEILGKTVQASRVYLTLFRENTTKADMINEWTDEGISSSISGFQNMDMSIFPWWMEKMHRKENIVIRDVNALPEIAAAEKEVLQAAGVKALISIPIYSHLGELWGTIGFDASNGNQKIWLDEDAKMLQVVGDMIYNYQNRCQTENALKESEARFRAIFKQAALGIILSNSQGKFLEVNQKMSEFLGYSAEELLNLTWEDITYFDDQEAAQSYVDQLKEGRFPFYSQEKRYRHREGKILWGNLTVSQILNAQGQPIYRLGMIEDIQGRKLTQQQLEKAKEAAEAANLAKSQFLANMSHELRTPLNAILGFTQLMIRSALTPIDHQEYLDIINRSGEHLLSLINDILDLSKIEAGKIELQTENFDLYYLLNSLQQMLSVKAQAKGLNLVVHCGENVPRFIYADQKKLKSVLINLLGNGIKFTSQGTITLRVFCSQSIDKNRKIKAFSISKSKERKTEKSDKTCIMLHFEIEDTGIGIAPSELDNLFDAFVQSQAGQKSVEGTGLGLAISKNFVNLMGGEIKVKSSLGVGSIFSFGIPCNSATIAPLMPLFSQDQIIDLEPNQPKYRILVVEDQWTNRKLLVNLLKSLGFAVKEAVNGQSGLALWQQWHPHLILMDMRMPVMNGDETIQAIRSQEKHYLAKANYTPVVIFALTASVFLSQRHHLLATGCDDFIPKPLQESELLSKIAHHLGVRYRYKNREKFTNESFKTTTPLVLISPKDLAFMSAEWKSQMYLAAVSARANHIRQLIEEIPQSYDHIIKTLNYLLNQLDFEQIAELTQSI